MCLVLVLAALGFAASIISIPRKMARLFSGYAIGTIATVWLVSRVVGF